MLLIFTNPCVAFSAIDTNSQQPYGGICIDEKDRIWIADTFRHQVKVFGTDGSFLFQFGTFGTEIGHFFFPVDLALDGHGRVYILEKGANRLQIFEIKE